MNQVALLIGVNHYQPDLGLAATEQGLAELHAALQQANPPFQSYLHCDRPLAEVQETVELVFRKRQPQDLVLLVLTGYALQTNGSLHFLQTDSNADAEGNVWLGTTLSSEFLRLVMDRSPAQRQIVILDCIFRRHLHSTSIPESPVNLQGLLKQEHSASDPTTANHPVKPCDRLVLAAHSRTHHAPLDLHPPELWGYLRYFAEGLQRGYADVDGNGILTVANLHTYAQTRLQIAAPAIVPTLVGEIDLAQSPLNRVTASRATLQYARLIEHYRVSVEIDSENRRVLTGRNFLTDIQRIFELSSQQAEQIESEVLRPWWEYHQRLRRYRQHLAALAAQADRPGPSQQAIQTLKQAFYLTDEQTAVIDVATFVDEQQQQRELHLKNLARYEQAFLAALLRQYPLTETDRQGLLQLQALLALTNDEVEAAEHRIVSRIQQLVIRDVSAEPSRNEPPPPKVVEPLVASPESMAPGGDSPPAATPNRERLLEHLERTAFQGGAPAQNNVVPEGNTPESFPPPSTEIQPPPGPPPPLPAPVTERQPSSNRPFIIDWLVPLLLIATLAGTAAAVLLPNLRDRLPAGSSMNAITNPDEAFAIGRSKTREQQYTDAIAAYSRAIQLKDDLIAAYINRGIVYTKLGEYDKAIEDYTTVVKKSPNTRNELIALSNRSHVYYDKGDYERAFADADAVLRREPGMPEALVNRANARLKRPNAGNNAYEEAIKDYDRAIQTATQGGLGNAFLAGVYTNRGNAHLFADKTDAAIADYNEALRRERNYVDAIYNRGLAYAAKGDVSAAIEDLSQAADLYKQRGDRPMENKAREQLAKLPGPR